MNMPIGRLFAATLAASVAIGFSSASYAAKTLRMSSQWTETTAGAQVDKWWASEIEARTNGEIKIKIFYEGVLGKANENLALIQNGSIDLAAMSPSYFPAELPFHSAPNSIPMAMARVEEATELMERLLTEVPEFDEEAKRNGMKALFFHHLNPYLLVCKEPGRAASTTWRAGKSARGAGTCRAWCRPPARSPSPWGSRISTKALGRGTVDCIPLLRGPDDQLQDLRGRQARARHHAVGRADERGVDSRAGVWDELHRRAAEDHRGGLVRGRVSRS